jgi:copper chaperone CopZ
MRFFLAALLLISTGALAAQEPEGLSTDPRLHIERTATHTHVENVRCHKDHAGLDLAAAEPEADAAARLEQALAEGGFPVTVEIRDLDCPYCAAAIEKAFASRSDIAAASVDLRKQTIILVVEAGEEISDQTIRKIINRRGYEVAAIARGAPGAEQ